MRSTISTLVAFIVLILSSSSAFTSERKEFDNAHLVASKTALELSFQNEPVVTFLVSNTKITESTDAVTETSVTSLQFINEVRRFVREGYRCTIHRSLIDEMEWTVFVTVQPDSEDFTRVYIIRVER